MTATKTFSTDDVLQAIKNVKDPELGKTLVELGMIQNLLVTEDAEISLTVVLTTPACPLKDTIANDIQNQLKQFPAKEVSISWQSKISGKAEHGEKKYFPNIKNIVAVASGKGGVGKSMCATNLAVSLAGYGAKVGLIDADIYGPSLPKMLGHHSYPEMLEDKTVVPVEVHGIKAMSFGFLVNVDEPVMWRGAMLEGVLRQFFEEVRWGELDYLIVDLPPGTGDIHLSLAQKYSLNGAVIVSTPQEVASEISYKGLKMFQKMGVPILGLIENMSFLQCNNCTDKIYPFGKGRTELLAKQWKVPYLGEIPMLQNISESHDKGIPISTLQQHQELFADIARGLAAQISVINFNR